MQDTDLLLKLRLKLFNLDINNLPEWVNSKVLPPEQIQNYRFYNLLPPKYYEHQPINSNLILGTTHARYNKGTWIDMLKYLKRNKDKISREIIEQFILDERVAETKTVLKYGDAYFIDSGNHRLCFAKFLNLDSVYCDVIEYFFDKESYDMYNTLQDMRLEVSFKNREDWGISYQNLNIFVKFKYLEDLKKYLPSIKISKLDILIKKLTLKKGKTDEIVYCRFKNDPESKKIIRDYLILQKVLLKK